MSASGPAPLVVFGAGGHGREVLDIVEAVNVVAPTWRVLGVVADTDPLGAAVDDHFRSAFRRRGYVYLGPNPDASWGVGRGAVPDAVPSATAFVIGIGDPAARARIDQRIASEHGSLYLATLVHPIASLGSDNRIGAGCVIAAGARVTTNVSLGRHVHLNINATVSHDCVVDDYVTCAPGSTVCGDVRIGANTYIGAGATIIQGRRIGRNAKVGAGAVVVDDVADGVTVVGVPARPIVRPFTVGGSA